MTSIWRFWSCEQVQFTCSSYPCRGTNLRFWFFYKFNSHNLPTPSVAQFAILTLMTSCNSHDLLTPTVAQFAILTLWQVQFTCPHLPLPWPDLRFWLCDKFNSHVFLPLPWPKFAILTLWQIAIHMFFYPYRGPICDSDIETSSIQMFSYPYRGPICDSDFVTSSIHMSAYPYRGPICDSNFVTSSIHMSFLPLPWPKFAVPTLSKIEFTCPPTSTVAQFAILTLMTSLIHMSAHPYRDSIYDSNLCDKFKSHVLPTPAVA